MIARSSLTRYAAASSGGSRPAMRSPGASSAASAPSPRERVGQQVRPELRGAAAAVGQGRQADAAAARRAWSCADDRPRPPPRGRRAAGRATIEPRERRGPGGSPGLQNRWRRARRGAVGSTPTRSRHAPPTEVRCRRSRPDRPRPPSVEQRARARARRGWTARASPRPCSRSPRAVVDDERERLRTDGAAPRDLDALADAVVARLDGFAGPVVAAPPAVINATGVIVHTNLGRAPWPAAVADGGGGPRHALPAPRAGPRRPAVAARGHGSPRTTSSR